MKTKRYKVGILGLRMGKGWAEGIARNKDARLAALYDPDLEQARTVGAEYGIAPAATEAAGDEAHRLLLSIGPAGQVQSPSSGRPADSQSLSPPAYRLTFSYPASCNAQ